MTRPKKSAAEAGVSEEKSAKKPKKAAVGDGTIEVTWELAELPTAQHRAGLAGLVMLVDWMKIGGAKIDGVLEWKRRDDVGATLSVDRVGMKSLFDAAYAASVEDKEESQKRKNKKGDVVEPKAEVQRELVDEKTKKTKTKTVYVYDVTVPGGAFLLDQDPTRRGTNGLWIKLWRDFVWSIVRGVPAARGPYESRANKEPVRDADDAYDTLAKNADRSEGLAGTYFLGAQAITADGVPFEDRDRFFFLLQFWPFAISLYVPSVVDPREGTRNFDGSFAVVVPDVSQLETFCDVHFSSLRNRSPEKRIYRPEAAAVDIPVQSALDAALVLDEALARKEGANRTRRLVLGYDVVHVGKEGNNVRVFRSSRITPSRAMVDRYKTINSRFGEYFFRRQQILNLVDERPWWWGYDRLFETLSHERFLGKTGRYFGRDARNAFKDYEGAGSRQEDSMADDDKKPPTLASVVQQVVWNYAVGRVKARSGIDYDRAKANPNSHDGQKFNEELERATKDAFLAIRSRTGDDFVDYFSGTICSVRQRVGRAGYELLSEALLDNVRRAEVRTLTMLALSTVSGVFEKKSDQH